MWMKTRIWEPAVLVPVEKWKQHDQLQQKMTMTDYHVISFRVVGFLYTDLASYEHFSSKVLDSSQFETQIYLS